MARWTAVTAIIAVAMAGVVVLDAPPAAACGCAGNLIGQRDEAEAVFAGTVVGQTRPIDLGEGPDLAQLTVEVDRVWSGEVYERQAVLVDPVSGMCGLGTGGTELLVFAFPGAAAPSPDGPAPADEPDEPDEAGPIYEANLCTGVWLDDELDDPAAMLGGSVDDLGPPAEPLAGTSTMLAADSAAPSWWPVASAVGAAALVLGAVGWWRIGRQRRPA